jgi:hypothetical protein
MSEPWRASANKMTDTLAESEKKLIEGYERYKKRIKGKKVK